MPRGYSGRASLRSGCRAEHLTPVLRHACDNAFYRRRPAIDRAFQIESARRSAGSTALDRYYVDDGPPLLCRRRNGTGAASELPTISIAGCRASEAGHGQAQMMLGRYLTRGLAGDIDLVEGRQWLERAVEQGITESELDLGTVPAMPTLTRSSRRRARTT